MRTARMRMLHGQVAFETLVRCLRRDYEACAPQRLLSHSVMGALRSFHA